MVGDHFALLLEEIGRELEIPDLRPDRNESCLIRMRTGLEIQLEVDKSNEYLMLATDFGEIPTGGYRVNLFKQAMKSNAMSYPRYGTFAWSQQANHLVMFKMFPLPDLNGHRVIEYLPKFCKKGLKWKEALEKEEIPDIAAELTAGSSGMFGL